MALNAKASGPSQSLTELLTMKRTGVAAATAEAQTVTLACAQIASC